MIAWIDENLLAEAEAALEQEQEQAVVPEPEELRRIVIESTKSNRETMERIVDIACEAFLPASLSID